MMFGFFSIEDSNAHQMSKSSKKKKIKASFNLNSCSITWDEKNIIDADV